MPKNDEIIVSYKSIYINIYSIVVLSTKTGIVMYKHESFNLWENKVMSFFNEQTQHLISLNNNGMHLMSMQKNVKSVNLVDSAGENQVAHTLGSCNYLKLDP